MTELVDFDTLLRRACGKRVIVLGGYSGLGYARPEAVAAVLERLVLEAGDSTLYVSGGTSVGIGMAYRLVPHLAARMHYHSVRTAGILVRHGFGDGNSVAPQDWLCLVDAPAGEWRVLDKGRSLMVSIAAASSGCLVYFGGGAIAGEELSEAVDRGVPAILVAGSVSRPDPAAVAAALARNPCHVVDGCSGIAGIRIWNSGMDGPILPV